MRYFYEPNASDTESEASVVSYRSRASASQKAKGKQRAIEPSSTSTSSSIANGKTKCVGASDCYRHFILNLHCRTRKPSKSRDYSRAQSPSTSSGSSASADSEEDDEDDDSDDLPQQEIESAVFSGSDSEEDEFPVNPTPAETRRCTELRSAFEDIELSMFIHYTGV